MIARNILRVAACATACAIVAPANAVDARAKDVTTLTLGAWHGAPAVSPDIRDFALRVTGRPGAMVDLRATDVPNTWLVSFCTGRVCMLQHTTITLRRSVQSVELSFIPKLPGAPLPAVVHLTAYDGERRTELYQTLLGARSK